MIILEKYSLKKEEFRDVYKINKEDWVRFIIMKQL